MKRTLKIFTGQPFGGQEQPNVTVVFDKPMPDYKDSPVWQEEYNKTFNSEAEKLEQVLIDCLPGGTYDRLLGLMLKRKSSHFIISHKEPTK
jgi:hypothetical protein